MSRFNFKYFQVDQSNSGLKIGTDAFLLGALTDFSCATQILDIGTGTGVLALIAAQKTKDAEITGVELDLINYNLAKKNFNQSTWSNRLYAIHTNIKSYTRNQRFDLIISNPPFFQDSTLSSARRTDLAKHNESLGATLLMNKVNELLTTNGCFWCILPYDHSVDYLNEAKKNRLFIVKRILIYGKPGRKKRIIYCFSRTPQNQVEESLTVRESSGEYSKAYKLITSDLHDREV